VLATAAAPSAASGPQRPAGTDCGAHRGGSGASGTEQVVLDVEDQMLADLVHEERQVLGALLTRLVVERGL